MNEPVYRLVRALARALVRVKKWRVIVEGAEHIPRLGAGVLAINHAGYLDFVFAAWSAVVDQKRPVRFLAKKGVFDHKVSGPLMRGMKHIPVDRTGDPRKALDRAIEALKAGELVAAFPEGSINRSFVPGRGKTGTVRMAQAAAAPVIPVAVWGAHRILTKGRPRNFQKGVVIAVSIGPPMVFDPNEDPRAATDKVMEKIQSLLAEVQGNYPQAPANDADRWWLPAHLGGSAPTPQQAESLEGT